MVISALKEAMAAHQGRKARGHVDSHVTGHVTGHVMVMSGVT